MRERDVIINYTQRERQRNKGTKRKRAVLQKERNTKNKKQRKKR